MRILYLYQYFGTPRGSWSTRAYELAKRWVAAGDQVTVVTTVYDKSDLTSDGLITEHRIDGIRVVALNLRISNKQSFAARLAGFAAYAGLASWFCLREPADVVLASSGPITVGLPALVKRALAGTPIVFEVRDLWPEGAIQLGVLKHPGMIATAKALERICYGAARRVVAASEGQAQWIRERFGIAVDVIPNASDNELAAKVGELRPVPDWARGRPLALYTGSLGLMNDCGQILRAAEASQKRGSEVTYVVIGDGVERPELERVARERGLRNVRFLGLLPKEDVLRWLKYGRCALLAFRRVPVLDTTSPNKLFDAFSCGAPMVQSTQGWMKDLLERERCGLNVAPDDPEELALAVERIAASSELHEELSANASRVARELFDRGMLADRFRNILLQAAQG